MIKECMGKLFFFSEQISLLLFRLQKISKSLEKPMSEFPSLLILKAEPTHH